MADHFTNFSLIVPLPNEEAQKYALALASSAQSARLDDEPPSNLPAFIGEMREDWHFDTEAEHSSGKWGIWIHSQFGGMDALCAFLQYLLQKFDPQGRVSFEWSNDCSKSLVDAFGGGAALVTATEIKTMSTWGWLQEQAA